jgi:hypothetical protein
MEQDHQITPSSDEEERKKRVRDRWLGIGLFFGLNVIVFPLITFLLGLGLNLLSESVSELQSAVNLLLMLLYFMPYVINIGLVIYLSVKRPQMALGMLIGFAISIGLVIIAGIVLLAACFVMIGSYS